MTTHEAMIDEVTFYDLGRRVSDILVDYPMNSGIKSLAYVEWHSANKARASTTFLFTFTFRTFFCHLAFILVEIAYIREVLQRFCNEFEIEIENQK